jgi:uncharacterized RDD family membrane protein YckC
MSVRPGPVALQDVEAALALQLSVDTILDLADEVIDRASATGNGATLRRLADGLEAAAQTRDDARGLLIAAQRASAAAGALGVPPKEPPAPERPAATSAGESWSTGAVDTTVPAAAVPADAVRLAGWWSRVLAVLVDWFALSTAFFAVPSDASGEVWLLALVCFPVGYFALFHAYNKGRTIGKALFGIAVRLDDGKRVDLSRALARALVQGLLWVTVIGGIVDSLAPLGDRRNRALHDRAAGTIVVRVR